MGIFRVDCELQDAHETGPVVTVKDLLVDSGAEYSWIPAATLAEAGVSVRKRDIPFLMANGQQITRHVGYALIRCGEFETVDEVVFALEGDLTLLGCRTLEGFAAMIDPRRKRLIASGPLLAAGGEDSGDQPT